MSQQRRPLTKDDMYQLKYIQEGRLSPDGRTAVYAVEQINLEENRIIVTLWLVDVESGRQRPLTSGKAKDTAPAWSPDGTQIAFMSTRGEKPQIYAIPVDGGEARQVTHVRQGVGGGPAWSPDGTQIAFTAGPNFETPPDPNKPFRVDRHVYRFDAMGYLDWAVQDIYVVPAEGGEARQLTDDRSMNSLPQWSPDGREIMFMISHEPHSHRSIFNSRIGILNLESGQVRDVLGEWGSVSAMGWLPDSKRVVFMGQPRGRDIGSKDDIWVVDSKGGEPECRTESLEYHPGGWLFGDMPTTALFFSSVIRVTPDAKSAYVQVQRGGSSQVYQVALKGKEAYKPVLEGDNAQYMLDVQGKHILYANTSVNEPPDLYATALDGSSERRLTSVNEEFLSGIRLPEWENLKFRSEDGTEVEGWYIRPTTDAQAPYPTILYIHGGPNAAYGNVFSFDNQMLAGAGYGVLYINHRASTGYGQRFATMIKGDWGNHDYKDLMAGVDYAIEKGLADPDRLGICGTSGGGNLTTWTIGNTRRFKAAIPCNPVTNWNSFYGTSDIGVIFALEQLGGHPWEIPEIYTKCSPISYAHNCTTPTLCVQAEHDWRCPAEQSEQFYSVLKANGCTVEMLRQPNGAHGASGGGEPIMREVHNAAMLDWFNHFILGQPRQEGII